MRLCTADLHTPPQQLLPGPWKINLSLMLFSLLSIRRRNVQEGNIVGLVEEIADAFASALRDAATRCGRDAQIEVRLERERADVFQDSWEDD